MAEQMAKTPGGANSGPGGRQPGSKSTKQQVQDTANEAVEAGRDLKDRVVGLAESSVEQARARAEEFAETAKEFASEAGETLKQRAYEQKEAGADYISNIADAIRRASHEFDNDLPIAGLYMRKAASKVEEISDTVHYGDLSTLVRGVQDFARRQPTAFLGLAVLAGFGAVRFLKSSGGPAHASGMTDPDVASEQDERNDFSR